mgnify:CR=1 FL=1
MLVLNRLQYQRRIDAPGAGALIQKGEHQGRAVLERLVERGLIEARGKRRDRVYYLSAGLYRELGAPSGYVRAHGFDPIQLDCDDGAGPGLFLVTLACGMAFAFFANLGVQLGGHR